MDGWDAIVAGGGPAGSSTASYLGLRGRRALVLERERFPRFHLGESLLPFAADLFRELGVLDAIERRYLRKPGARFLHEESGARFTYYFDCAIDGGRPHAWQVPRADFDQLLLENARRLQAPLGGEAREEHAVRAVRFLEDAVEVEIEPRVGARYVERAPVFVDATGRDALLARERGLKVPDAAIDTHVACFTHYAGCEREPGEDEGNFTLVMFDGGWWWFIPFKGDVTSVGVVFEKEYTRARRGRSPAELFDGALAEQRVMPSLLGRARRVRPVESTGNWSYRSAAWCGDRHLLVGDAAAFIDPLFSTGVLMAVMGGKLAASAIDEAHHAGDFSAARFAGYQERAVAGADLFKRLVHEFYGAEFRRMLVAQSQNPSVCQVITSMLAGDVYRPRVWHQLLREGFSRMIDGAPAPGERVRTIAASDSRSLLADR